jgi:hypothetical protein
MIPLFDDPLLNPADGPLPTAAEHLARTGYLETVQAAQCRCEAEITAARTAYVQAEHTAWTAYQAASDTAVRAWLSPPSESGNRWFTPAAGSHPLAQETR